MAPLTVPSFMYATPKPAGGAPPPVPDEGGPAPSPMKDAGDVAPPPGPVSPTDHGPQDAPDGQPPAPRELNDVDRAVVAHMGEYAFVSASKNLDQAAIELDRNFAIGKPGFAPDFLAFAAADTVRGAQALQLLGLGSPNAPSVMAGAGEQMLELAKKVSGFASSPPDALEGGLQARDVILRMRDDIDGFKAYTHVGREKIREAGITIPEGPAPADPADVPRAAPNDVPPATPPEQLPSAVTPEGTGAPVPPAPAPPA